MEHGNIRLTWRDIEKLTKKVGKEIVDDELKFDYIVAVGRGGYVPGVILSHFLSLPLLTELYQTRDGGVKQGIDLAIKSDIHNGKSILLLDDINDTGKTFLGILEEWDYTDECKGEVITAALLQRYSTAAPAGIVARSIDDDRWVDFPWEKKQ